MFSNKLKFYREQLGMTQLQFAQRTGLSIGYICHLEKGSRKNPSIKTMERIAVALNKTVREVFFSKDISQS